MATKKAAKKAQAQGHQPVHEAGTMVCGKACFGAVQSTTAEEAQRRRLMMGDQEHA